MPDFTGSQIDHLNVAVPDLPKSLAFYTPVLESLGIVEVLTVDADPIRDQLEMHGFGWAHKPFFWLVENGKVGSGVHLAFTAKDRATVRRFYDVEPELRDDASEDGAHRPRIVDDHGKHQRCSFR
jgi:catechol 2,3-dioxygenase-like lactoylglutathione lyase family enzyme